MFSECEKTQIEKSRKNFLKVLGKFYFKFEKLLNEICEILEETLKRQEFL